MRLYGVFDTVKKCYAPPFVARNDEDAIRMFLMDCKKLPFINDLRLKYISAINLDDELMPIGDFAAIDIPINLGEEK